MSRDKHVPIRVLSFFSGGGFLDIGFEQAGFRIAWSNDNNPVCARLYEHGITSWRKSLARSRASASITNTQDIRSLSASDVLREAFGPEIPKVFALIGGPPCPDFSNGGLHAGKDGKRGKLTKTFVTMIGRLKPTFFLMENVAGLYRFRKHRRFLASQLSLLRTKYKYFVDYAIINALSLGVPQSRERLFVVGFKKRIVHAALGRRLRPNETGWFPWPSREQYDRVTELAWPGSSPYGMKPLKSRGIPLELTVFPSLYQNDPEKAPNGDEYFIGHSAKFTQRAEGDVSGKSFKRLHRYRFSPTVWYGNQEVHLHPSKPRRLSVREALRIQTVPDTYVLPDDVSLSAKFKMIGNGVPCLMAKEIAVSIKSFLETASQNIG
jgi:DNA (cytosine-5)-methyltransferase 1